MFQSRLVLIYCFCLSLVHADYYSANSDLKILVDLEAFIVQEFEQYLNKQQRALDNLDKFVDNIEQLQADIEIFNLEEYYGNPLTAFTTISRLVNQWKHEVFDIVFSTKDLEDYQKALADTIQSYELQGPTPEDLLGAARGIWQLQQTYKLRTSKLVRGILLEEDSHFTLSASDSYEIGSNLHELQLYPYAVEWLMQARALNVNPNSFPNVSNVQILELLSTALNYTGNFKLAHKLNSELLRVDPNNEAAPKNQEIYEHKLSRQQSSNPNVTLELPEEIKPRSSFDLYQRVCRGEVHQTPRQQRDLRCRYSHNNVPYRRLAPFKLEELNADPYVAIYHQLMHEQEMKMLMEQGAGQLERSRVGENNASAVLDLRTSKNTWLWYENYRWLGSIKQRLMDITGLGMESAEPLQLVNYGTGGRYEPHYDFLQNCSHYGWKGNRIVTALFYLNDVQAGGATAFPFLKIAVAPVKGSLLIWNNLHSSLEKDFRTLHAGCPVLRGSKWICNEWFHEGGQEFKRRCGLTVEGEKSAKYAHL